MTELTEEDIEGMEEAADEAFGKTGKKKTDLPEAPVSITVRGYYKGFSVLITKRNAEGNVELEKVITAIDNMVAKGFKPSWNEETNHFFPQVPTPKSYAEKDTQKASQEGCLHRMFTMKRSTGHTNPANKGRIYKACLDCNKFLGWHAEGQDDEMPEMP